jgi:type I site-specific restriction-modification system R (restriction) subunit
MIEINYPQYPFKIRPNEAGKGIVKEKEIVKDQLFDPFRKKWVALTPEEWVRQNILQYLDQVCQYPTSLIAIEKSIQLGELTKRFDILIYKNDKPWMIIECKEANVAINDKTIAQLYQYQQVLEAQYLIASNGHETVGAEIKTGKLHALQNFPAYL